MGRMRGLTVISFKIPRRLLAVAKIIVVAAVVLPCTTFAQPTLEALSAEEQRILDEIDREMSLNGPYSEALIELLTDLSFIYEEIGAYVPAEEAIRRVQSVIRANQGLQSLDQAPVIRRLINRAAENGNAVAAWNLSNDLLALAYDNPDDVRSAGILSEAGDKRLNILERYDSGEMPPEIVLGCFYDDTVGFDEVRFRGSQPMAAVRIGPEGRTCSAGDRNAARLSLVASAQQFYLQSLNLVYRNDAQASSEVPETLMKLVRTSYLFTNPSLGATSLRNLLAYEAEYSDGWLPQIEARIQIADWDLLHASHLGTRYEKTARAAYEQAYELMIEHRIDQQSIDAIFAPDIPVVLPSFIDNPLVSPETLESNGYIDVAFVIAEDGKSEDIEVVDTMGDVSRSAERELVRTVKFSRFRPRLTDGRFTTSDPIVVRYYVNEVNE
jgi:hypothetical protein